MKFLILLVSLCVLVALLVLPTKLVRSLHTLREAFLRNSLLRQLLVSLCVLVALVRGESCSNPGACSQTTCDSSSKMACISGICTCVSAVGCSQTSCGVRSQCSNCTCDHHHSSSHHTSEHHCYDGHCVCTTGHSFFPGK